MPPGFWGRWALAGMVVLSLAFATFTLGWALAPTAPWRQAGASAMLQGLFRFTLLVATPAMLVVWAAAAPLVRRVGLTGWRTLLVAAVGVWAGAAALLALLWPAA